VQGLDLVNPPEGAKVGETVFFEDDTAEPDRPSISNARFKKLLKVLLPPSSLPSSLFVSYAVFADADFRLRPL
jgi:hypothetical protein